MEFEKIWEKYRPALRRGRPAVVAGLIGAILLALGVFAVFLITQNEPEIEILPANESAAVGETIFVDLRGAVEKPGVYELPSSARVNDLLVRAGGLAASADREWLDKNINLAQKLTDGVKIYIPGQSERVEEQESKKTTSLININTASQAQLDPLWGIGEARAKAIIAGRPYQAVEELLSRKIVPSNVFEKIKDEITVF